MSSTEADIVSKKGHETFEPAFEADQLPHIAIPNLPEDAKGLTAKELAEVPPATELKGSQERAAPASLAPKEDAAQEDAAQSETKAASAPVLDALDALPVLDEEHAQEMPVHVDTWVEVFYKRTEKLTVEIRELNARLDVLEKNQRVIHGGS